MRARPSMLASVAAACALGSSAGSSASAATPLPHAVALPGTAPISMDYLAFDAATGQLVVPAGNSGKVDLLEASSLKLASLEGFPTATVKTPRGERKMGPSSASVGGGYFFIGNRADSTVCAFEEKGHAKKGCAKLDSMPDGVAYVAPTHEVWVTTPRKNALVILKLGKSGELAVDGTLQLSGAPEGYSVDETRGLFFTNLEDKDRTLAIDAKGRKVVSDFKPGCNEDGPKGLIADAEWQRIYVACSDRVKSLDEKSGVVLGELSTGDGVDNIDWVARTHTVYVASGKEGKLSVTSVDQSGKFGAPRTVATAPGVRTVVVDPQGAAYLPDSRGGRILVVTAANLADK